MHEISWWFEIHDMFCLFSNYFFNTMYLIHKRCLYVSSIVYNFQFFISTHDNTLLCIIIVWNINFLYRISKSIRKYRWRIQSISIPLKELVKHKIYYKARSIRTLNEIKLIYHTLDDQFMNIFFFFFHSFHLLL